MIDRESERERERERQTINIEREKSSSMVIFNLVKPRKRCLIPCAIFWGIPGFGLA